MEGQIDGRKAGGVDVGGGSSRQCWRHRHGSTLNRQSLGARRGVGSLGVGAGRGARSLFHRNVEDRAVILIPGKFAVDLWRCRKLSCPAMLISEIVNLCMLFISAPGIAG